MIVADSGWFNSVARRMAHWIGHPLANSLAFAAVIVWLVAGPFFGFSDAWHKPGDILINALAFWILFVIQNSQNRDTAAMQIKLDELIRASSAHNVLLDLEELSEEQLEQIRQNYEKLARAARRKAERAGKSDQGSPSLALAQRAKPKRGRSADR